MSAPAIPVSRPTKKSVTTTYWACHISAHRHAEKEVAQACIDRAKTLRSTNVWTEDALRLALARWRKEGLTFKQLGEAYGVSSHTARTVVRRAVLKVDGLSYRAMDSLSMPELRMTKAARRTAMVGEFATGSAS